MRRSALAVVATIAFLSPAVAQSGDAARGQQNFRACAPCHSLALDRNMTGPSLADLWGRKAGGLSSFERYSEALKASGIIWDDRSLDGRPDQNLRKLEPAIQVKAITYCHDTYRVTTADGKTQAFWERNLRFKTDASKDGPQNGAPAILPAGMMGDRASVVFAAPDEISKLIEQRC